MKKFQVELSVIDPEKGYLQYCLTIPAITSGDAYTKACGIAIDREQTINFVQVWFPPDTNLDEVI